MVKKSGVEEGNNWSNSPYKNRPNDGSRMSFNQFEKKYNEFEGFKRDLPESIEDNIAFQMFLEH